MRYFIASLFTLVSFVLLTGQKNDRLELAVQNIQSNAQKWGLEEDDFKDVLISSEATSEKGITYMYLQQSYRGIPIRNAMMTVIMRDGKVLSDAHNFVLKTKSRINASEANISAEDAILNAAQSLGVSVKSKPIMSSRTDQGKLSFEFPELTKTPIPAELKYELVDERLVLVWNLNLDMKTSSDYWDMNIDAQTGAYVSKNNFTIYCQHRHDAYARHDNCAIKTFRKINENTQSVHQAIQSKAGTAKYNVFALPAESPNHGGRKIVTDDQYPEESPFGWHDTNGVEGPEFQITRGNNVYAYQDKNDDDVSDGPDTDGGNDLNFDFPIDLNEDSRENPDASVTNLFYMVNMMHDITSKLGFDEAFGNFQQKNYTNKGDGGDYVLAQAFDGITLHENRQDLDAQGNPTKINNANFATPSDGFNGRMQMYFWNNSGGAVSIDAPESIKGFIEEYGEGNFGKPIPNETEPAITGPIVMVKDKVGNPNDGCTKIDNATEVSGKVAMIDRGFCEFGRKVKRAQEAGAIAAIICNVIGVNGGNGEEVLGMSGGADGGTVTIPSIFLKKSDCDRLRLLINAGQEVVITFKEKGRQGPDFLDGSLDNGIIAHEFGHGISTRLTGGRQNSGCLNNDEQMGEGWSDFFALIMTHESGDKGEDVRGIGTFASAQKTTSGGIRRFPYSTDMSINPQTFDDIKGTTAPHPLGELWVGMLWDMYWAFIGKYGYDSDWSNTNSGNYKAVYLVMEGMKMQPCSPGFVAGRDAIFKADQIHYNGENLCMIWEVFARRGLGYFADGGKATDRNDGKQNFDVLPTCIENLKITSTTTSSVDPGEEVDIAINVVNHIPSQQKNVIITDELQEGMTYIPGSSNIAPTISGNVLTFEVGDLDYLKEVNISYKAKTSGSNKSLLLLRENFDGDFLWDIEKELGNEDWLPTVDLFRSPDFAFNILNVAAVSDASLRSIPYKVNGQNPVLRFWHRYNTQAGNDGGFVEISENGSEPEIVSGSKFLRNSYNGPLSYSTLAIPSLQSFSGNSGGNWSGDLEGPWVDSYIDLADYKGKDVVFRFRFASNETVAATGDLNGWFVDDFELLDIYKYNLNACVAADGGQGTKVCDKSRDVFINSDGNVNVGNVDLDYFNATLTPNPAHDFVGVTMSAPVRTAIELEMINAQGKITYTTRENIDQNKSTVVINTSIFPAGFYTLKIQDGQHVTAKKLIIQ